MLIKEGLSPSGEQRPEGGLGSVGRPGFDDDVEHSHLASVGCESIPPLKCEHTSTGYLLVSGLGASDVACALGPCPSSIISVFIGISP